jgi:hypothetical protein
MTNLSGSVTCGKETVSTYRTLKPDMIANEGVGIVNDDETLVAIDFLGKLDPKRFTSLLTVYL